MIGHTVFGSGPRRALALHGWLGDRGVFDPVLTALDPEQVSLALMDYRGYGASRSMSGPFDIATIARDALTLADHLGWTRFGVIGHSMGGKAALRVAIDAPQRVASLLGIAPVWAGRVPFDPGTLSLFRNAARDVRLRAAIIDDTTGNRWPAAWSRSLAQDSTEVSLTEAVAAYFESWACDDFARQCTQITANVRVVVGAHDRGVTQELVSQTWLKELPNAGLSVLAECGHYPMLECPPALGVVFDSFFANMSVA